MTPSPSLPDQWRAEAQEARRYGAEAMANIAEAHADQLEARDREERLQLVTLREAEELSGFSYSALEKGVRSGRIPNAGTKHHPRIRLGDLPRKPGQSSVAPEGPDLAGRILAHSP